MRMIFKIHIDKPLTDEEINFFNALSEEKKNNIRDRAIEDIYQLFENEDIPRECFKEISVEIVGGDA